MGTRRDLEGVVQAALGGVLVDPDAAQVLARREGGDKGRFEVGLAVGPEDRAALEADDGQLFEAVARMVDAAAYKRHKRAALYLVDAADLAGGDADDAEQD